jgi:hypothetical protein
MERKNPAPAIKYPLRMAKRVIEVCALESRLVARCTPTDPEPRSSSRNPALRCALREGEVAWPSASTDEAVLDQNATVQDRHVELITDVAGQPTGSILPAGTVA